MSKSQNNAHVTYGSPMFIEPTFGSISTAFNLTFACGELACVYTYVSFERVQYYRVFNISYFDTDFTREAPQLTPPDTHDPMAGTGQGKGQGVHLQDITFAEKKGEHLQ